MEITDPHNQSYSTTSMRNRMLKMLAPLPKRLATQIKFDPEASWSFTDLRIGYSLAQRVLNLPGINKKSVIFDATASIGGNTIAFAKYFDNIYSCELDNCRKQMLDHNLQLLGLTSNPNKNIITYCGYAQDYLDQLQYDVVFFDPPWGTDYKQHDKLRIKLNHNDIEQSFESVVAMAARNAKYIVVKLPQNYDLDFFTNALDGVVEIIHKEWHGRPNTALNMIMKCL